MTALERIELEVNNIHHEIKFLLKAFRVMREMAAENNIEHACCNSDWERKFRESLKEIDKDFKKRMSKDDKQVKCLGSGNNPCGNPDKCDIPWHYNQNPE